MAVLAAPYLIFAATWVAAALVPTFATGLPLQLVGGSVVITALLGSARFFLALAGMDVGTSFGGLGSSREMMFATLAEPALIMIVFTLALIAGSTQLSTVAGFMLSPEVGLRVSLGMALIGLVIVATAENARVFLPTIRRPISSWTMVHEAMVLEYSGRHLAMIELSSRNWTPALRLADRLRVRAVGGWRRSMGFSAHLVGVAAYVGKLAAAGILLNCSRRRSPRCASSACRTGVALMLDCSPPCCASCREGCDLDRLSFDIAHLVAGNGGLVLAGLHAVSLRIALRALITFALQAVVLALSVGWQAYVQDALHLYIISGDHPSPCRDRDPGGAASDRRPARHSPRGRWRRWSRPCRRCWPASRSFRCRWCR